MVEQNRSRRQQQWHRELSSPGHDRSDCSHQPPRTGRRSSPGSDSLSPDRYGHDRVQERQRSPLVRHQQRDQEQQRSAERHRFPEHGSRQGSAKRSGRNSTSCSESDSGAAAGPASPRVGRLNGQDKEWQFDEGLQKHLSHVPRRGKGGVGSRVFDTGVELVHTLTWHRASTPHEVELTSFRCSTIFC